MIFFFFASQMRHEPICKKVFNKKRKPFNSFKQRLQGTDIGTVKRQPPLKVRLMLEHTLSLLEAFHLVIASSQDKAWMLQMTLAYVLDSVPSCFLAPLCAAGIGEYFYVQKPNLQVPWLLWAPSVSAFLGNVPLCILSTMQISDSLLFKVM